MTKVQALVISMHQADMSLARKMNICSDVLIANQADAYGYCKEEEAGFLFEMVTTATRGASRNRNIAISCASAAAEYILFLDDDLVMHDGYEKIILEEFEAHPEAEAIKFNIASKGTRKISMSPIREFRKAARRSVASSGVWGLVIKKEVLLRSNLRFNESFGPGTEKYCGEDTIFLQEMLKKDIKFYMSTKYIADIYQDGSTWFEGYNEKYFRVSGMVLAHIYPQLAKLLAIRSAYRFSKREGCSMGFSEILRYYREGIQEELGGG